MRVHWRLPDNSVTETSSAEVEQLLFLLRLVQRVTLRGSRYRVAATELVVGEDEIAISVQLSAGDP